MRGSYLTHPLALFVPLTAFGLSLWSSKIPCVDEPLSIWASHGASGWIDVIDRANFTAHLPTYFWIARASSCLFQGEEGVRYASMLAGVGTILVSFFVLRWLAPRSLLPVTASTFLGSAFFLVWVFGCGRPYAWMALFFVACLSGLAMIERGRLGSGLALAGLGAGLATHMSSLAIPPATVLVAVGAWRAAARSASPRQWAPFVAIVLCTFPIAIAKAIYIAQDFVPVASAGDQVAAVGPVVNQAAAVKPRFWTDGWPPNLQIAFAIGAPVLACLMIFGRRRGWLERPADGVLSDSWLVLLAGAATTLPLVTLALYALADLRLFRFEYFMFNIIVSVFFLAVLCSTLAWQKTRSVACIAMIVLSPIATHHATNSLWNSTGYRAIDGLDGIPAYLQVLEAREDAARFVMARAEAYDLVLVESVWPESQQSWRYQRAEWRAYLMADLLRIEGFEVVNAFPAPVGPSAWNTDWAREVGRRIERSNRVWFIRAPYYGGVFGGEQQPAASWALDVLRKRKDLRAQPIAGDEPGAELVVLFERESPGSPEP